MAINKNRISALLCILASAAVSLGVIGWAISYFF